MPLRECHLSLEGVEFSFLIDESERIISQTVDKTGVWEENQLRLYKRLVPTGGSFVDIGANVGVNSIYMAKLMPDARVVSVEPSPQNYDVLLQNIAGTQIESHRLAIADHNGTVLFSGSGTNAKISKSAEGTEVRSTTLDTFTEECGLDHIDLMKVDVEGYSDAVLSDSSRTLSRTSRLIMEFSVGDVTYRFQCDRAEVIRHFQSLIDVIKPHFNYLYFISRRDGLISINDAHDIGELLSVEYEVGDILASKTEEEDAMAMHAFALRRIRELMFQNHKRIVEIQALQQQMKDLQRSQ